MRGRLAIAFLLAVLPAAASAATTATLTGTTRPDLLVGTSAVDRVSARGGNDRVAVEYDGARDVVSCGAGRDVVAADLRDVVRADCEVVSRRIHRDRHGNPEAQHESEVEPDSHTVGRTTVAVFQVGRNRTGGASSIGFSTSTDDGRTWRQGNLPGLTPYTSPPGPSARASDPVVSYDPVRRVWLASTLAIAQGTTRLTIHRSPDGIRWSAPVEAARADQQELAYDKNWLTCDDGASSRFRGRCYLAYTLIGGDIDSLAVQFSDDGGRTWSAPATRRMSVTGVIPAVQPDGTVSFVFWSGRNMVSVRSADGGATLEEPVLISPIRSRDNRPLRAPPLVAADVDGAGRVVAIWHDCRFRAGCGAQDVVLSRSEDGLTWTAPVRVTTGRNAVLPTLAVERGTGRTAIAYYVLHRDGVDAEVVVSADGVRFGAPQRLTPRRMPFAWMPSTTLGRMLADYIGVTWVRGRPLVVYALASPPAPGGDLRQAIYAARG